MIPYIARGDLEPLHVPRIEIPSQSAEHRFINIRGSFGEFALSLEVSNAHLFAYRAAFRSQLGERRWQRLDAQAAPVHVPFEKKRIAEFLAIVSAYVHEYPAPAPIKKILE